MSRNAVYKYCKQLGCCEACCIRYIGIKNPKSYENIHNFVVKFQEEDDKIARTNEPEDSISTKESLTADTIISNNEQNVNGNSVESIEDATASNTKTNSLDSDVTNNTDLPPNKKQKLGVCVSCLGVLQEDNWPECYLMVKEMLLKKGYQCDTFACALSAPIATLLREKAISLRLAKEFQGYDINALTALKEAWKWSFGVKLSAEIEKSLDSGAVSPLLITVNLDYVDDLQELEILKQVSPQLFEERSKQKRRFVTEFTRRSVEQALESASLESLMAAGGALPASGARARCVSVACAHAPMYLAGRYIKLSRNLPQSPWILDGKRVLPSSVQEIIYKPLADFYKLEPEDADRRLKLVAAGREDVDVRCLGDGRPFAIEITDPTRQLTPEELATACELISKSEDVVVKQIVPITREDLVQLKKGEEKKCKTYEALCIKLSHSKYDDVNPDSPIRVTPEDISRINSFHNNTGSVIIESNKNTAKDAEVEDIQNSDDVEKSSGNVNTCKDTSGTENGDVRITIQQKTPIRVLHRRPLLTRTRHILQLRAVEVPDHPQLFRVFVRTSAGTYVKEWVHGELGRTSPALGDALGAQVDLLALDVTAVHLDWPPVK